MIGKTVSHYTIVGRLGHGGMGVVYKAVDNRLQRTVALKFLPPGLADSEESRERLLREARMASTLEHQNICAIHEVDETPDGQVFICMSFYEGRTLSEMEQEGPLPVMEALRIAIQVAEGLAHAHGQGVIHRDIKPANVMLTTNGVTKVMDFGLARQEGQERLTRTGTTVGTLAYMSPEQVTGNAVDARSDVWSAGVLLFEMLTGQLPFTGDYEAAVAYSIVHEAPRGVREFNPGVSAELDAVIRRCLARRPADRYATAAELLADLRRTWQILSPPGAVPQIQVPSHIRKTLVRPRIWIPLAALALIAAAWLASPILLNAFRRTPPPPPLPTPRKVAVLPFHSASPDIASRCLAEGFRVFITDRLSLMEEGSPYGWTVSVASLRSTGIHTAGEVRLQENVNLVVTGELTLQKMSDASLVLAIRDPKSGKILRQEELKGDISSLSTFQQGLMNEVLRMLEFSPAPNTSSRISAGDTALPGAFRQYIQGLGALAIQLDDSGGVDMARNLFQGAVANDPDYADAWRGLAAACYWKAWADASVRMKWLEESASATRRALAISPQASSHRLLATILEAEGKTEEAYSEYLRALQAYPGYYEAECDLAWAFLDKHRLKEAEQHFQAAIRLRPDYWRAYNYLGYLYNSVARYTEAEKMFAEAIRLAPENVGSYGNLIAIYYKNGQIDKIHEILDRSLPPKPDAVLLSNVGTICFQLGMYLDAAGLFERAIAVGRKDFDYVMWGNLAECYRQLANQPKARQAFDQALRLGQTKLLENPADASVRSRLALYYAMTGRKTEASREIQAARKQAPADVDVLIRTVRVCELAGQRDAAIQSARELVARSQSLRILMDDPDLKDLRKDPRFTALATQTK